MANGSKRRWSKYANLMTGVRLTKTNELITVVLALLKGQRGTPMRVAFLFGRPDGARDRMF